MKTQVKVRTTIVNHRDGILTVYVEALDPDGFWFVLDSRDLGWEDAQWEVTNLAHAATETLREFGLTEADGWWGSRGYQV